MKSELRSTQSKIVNLTTKVEELEKIIQSNQEQTNTQESHDTTSEEVFSSPLNTSNRYEILSDHSPTQVESMLTGPRPSILQRESPPTQKETMTTNTVPFTQKDAPTNRYTSTTQNTKGPILIIADSMMRGVKQTLLARDHYVNKQIIH